MSERILYISYDGMLEPLGQSQVLAYLEKLAPGRLIHLISFEKPDDWQDIRHRDSIRRRTKDAGIVWHPLRYHKRPTAPATAYDIVQGGALAVALTLKHRFEIVHARSYVAGVMALAAKRLSAKLLFDMRGFWADERVDGGLWPAGGRLFRSAKSVERHLLLAADHVVTLTHASEIELARFSYLQGRMPPITVVPTCADLDRFTIQGPSQSDPFVLGYLGSVGTRYLLDEMLRCFKAVKSLTPGARLLMVNRGDHPLIERQLSAHCISPGEVDLIEAAHADVPELIGRMTAAMALYQPGFSPIACAPTKLAEYLGCGVPCLGNAGVGDVAEILEGRRVGVAMPGFTDKRIKSSVSRLISLARERDVQQRCRTAALDLFSLPHGVAAYERVYRELAST